MSIPLIVGGTTFDYPVSGDEPGWGAEATDWASAVTVVLNDLQGTDDILQTTFTVANNQVAAADVNGLQFNTGTVRAAEIIYSVYRTSTANPSGHAETGSMQIVYDNSASAGSKWAIGIGMIVGNSGVSFTILDSGQVQYTSTDINGVGYSGVMHFRAKSLLQA